MSRPRPAPEARHRTRRSSDRVIPVAGRPQLSRPYLLEWSTQNCRQKELLNVEEFQEEMVAVERAGWRKLAIVRGECDMGVLLGIELDKKRGGWVWEFPETEIRKRKPEGEDGETKEQDEDESDEDEGIRICRASLIVKEQLPILLLDGLPFRISSRPYRPSRIPSNARPNSKTSGKRPPKRSGLEDSLWQALIDIHPIEDLVAELIYDMWLQKLDSLPPLGSDSVDVQWTIARALETNADITKSMERRGDFSTITSADWSNLAERLHRRMQLSITVALQAHAQEAQNDPKDSNSRSLDRIAYLGGLLLPLTVVSGILSIESSYGPEGKSFWVFWLASGLSSLLAILIIYADHMRTLDVWMEVAATEILDLDHNKRFQANRTPRRREYHSSGDPERGEAKLTTALDGGVYVVQHRGDGTRGRAWRRGELGWVGAMKKMSGWYRWRGSPGMEFRMPGWERKVKNLVW
ncbi:unnamed protein product [Fusarium fujikuroi]|uniref:Uncharacterized protein n=1 Tax=Fusarium fujikuroi TaxID=5127 RepID=A0A9Q9S258_FUSFU|nr:uncharacterized protein FFE2_12105 [Fusarium fujikuroi]SCO49696.1 uncharacterized protein FFNC_12785 [Fusarium fujikuroi]SCV56193.1 uncharacterized protein FFFS_12116 [Fusarium fujikuroi]VTT72633.1 unnamed protein product [Fusarium fujikuroi]VTT84043.1 unnamed protein product [Fusarium fujikuroi]